MSARPKDNRVFLNHIMQEIEAAEMAAALRSQNDEIAKRAVVRSLEIIGEASKNISADFKEKYADIPWRDMTDMRNMLIHEYFGVSMLLVWQVVETELPMLKTQIKKLLQELE